MEASRTSHPATPDALDFEAFLAGLHGSISCPAAPTTTRPARSTTRTATAGPP